MRIISLVITVIMAFILATTLQVPTVYADDPNGDHGKTQLPSVQPEQQNNKPKPSLGGKILDYIDYAGHALGFDPPVLQSIGKDVAITGTAEGLKKWSNIPGLGPILSVASFLMTPSTIAKPDVTQFVSTDKVVTIIKCPDESAFTRITHPIARPTNDSMPSTQTSIKVVPPTIPTMLSNQSSPYQTIHYPGGVTVNPTTINHPSEIVERNRSTYQTAADLTPSYLSRPDSLNKTYTTPSSPLTRNSTSGLSSPSSVIQNFNRTSGYNDYLNTVSSKPSTSSYSSSSYTSHQPSYSGSSLYSSALSSTYTSTSSLTSRTALSGSSSFNSLGSSGSFNLNSSLVSSPYGYSGSLNNLSQPGSLSSLYTTPSSISTATSTSRPSYSSYASPVNSYSMNNSSVSGSYGFAGSPGNLSQSNSLMSGYTNPSSLIGHTSIAGSASPSSYAGSDSNFSHATNISGYTSPSAIMGHTSISGLTSSSSWPGSSGVPTVSSPRGFGGSASSMVGGRK